VSVARALREARAIFEKKDDPMAGISMGPAIGLDKRKISEVVDLWKKALNEGDKLLDASQGVIDAASGLDPNLGWRQLRRRIGEVVNAVRALEAVRDRFYKNGCQPSFPKFRALIKSWGLPVKWHPKPPYKNSQPKLDAMSDSDLAEIVRNYGPGLQKRLKDMLNAGTAARRALLELEEVGSANPSDLETAMTLGKDFHKAVGGAIYGGIYGLLKRTNTLMWRFQHRDRYEDVQKELDLAVAVLDEVLGLYRGRYLTTALEGIRAELADA